MGAADRVAARYFVAMRPRYTPPLSKGDLDDLVDVLVAAARENARESVGGSPKGQDDSEWVAKVDKFLRPSMESVLESIQSPRECDNYGLARPLSPKQFADVAKKCRARDRY